MDERLLDSSDFRIIALKSLSSSVVATFHALELG